MINPDFSVHLEMTHKNYSKRYAHSAWPAKWQGFLVLLYAQMVLFLVDEMKFHGDGGHCWDGWTLLKHVDFLLFWVCILKALELSLIHI